MTCSYHALPDLRGILIRYATLQTLRSARREPVWRTGRLEVGGGRGNMCKIKGRLPQSVTICIRNGCSFWTTQHDGRPVLLFSLLDRNF
jgi:hypothetical protein